MSTPFDTSYWENRYRESRPAGTPPPNPHLVAEAPAPRRGRALDAGAGEGADACWLAARGWQVTAVDIAPTALDRARAHAEATVPDHAADITWVMADLTDWTPEPGAFSLVYSAYVHTTESPRGLYRRLAAAVAPGGTLLIVGHHPTDEHTQAVHGPGVHLTAQAATAVLDPTQWEIAVAETRSRTIERHGSTRTLRDTVFRARRRDQAA